MFIFLYTVFRNSSISDEHVFCVALHFTIGQKSKTPKNTKNIFETKNVFFVQNKDFSFEICNYIIATIVLFEIINHNVDGE